MEAKQLLLQHTFLPLSIDSHNAQYLEELCDEVIGHQVDSEVIFEGVDVGRAGPLSQLQQRLQAGNNDLIHGPFHLLLGHVHKLHNEVTLI